MNWTAIFNKERSGFIVAAFFILFYGIGVLASTQEKDRNKEDNFVISVDASEVVLHTLIEDPHGVPVSGIRKEDVQLLEDKQKQTIHYFRQEDVPVTAGIIVDHSGSMRSQMKDVISAAQTFARASNARDKMFVINFNEHVAYGLPDNLQFTDSPAILKTAIDGFPTTGRTAIYDAVLEGIRRVNLGGHQEKILVVISDGSDDASKHRLGEVMEAAEKSEAIIYCIGLFSANGEKPNPDFLRQLARKTGGEAFFPKESQQVIETCERIAKDIRAQYTIGYVPTNLKADEGYRKVEVSAHAPGHGKLVVRTRTGYYAGARTE
jgi:VWFA-related protein